MNDKVQVNTGLYPDPRENLQNAEERFGGNFKELTSRIERLEDKIESFIKDKSQGRDK